MDNLINSYYFLLSCSRSRLSSHCRTVCVSPITMTTWYSRGYTMSDVQCGVFLSQSRSHSHVLTILSQTMFPIKTAWRRWRRRNYSESTTAPQHRGTHSISAGEPYPCSVCVIYTVMYSTILYLKWVINYTTCCCCCCLYHDSSPSVQNILLYWHKLLHAAAVHRECNGLHEERSRQFLNNSTSCDHVVSTITCRHSLFRTHPLIFDSDKDELLNCEWVWSNCKLSLRTQVTIFNPVTYRWISVETACINNFILSEERHSVDVCLHTLIMGYHNNFFVVCSIRVDWASSRE